MKTIQGAQAPKNEEIIIIILLTFESISKV